MNHLDSDIQDYSDDLVCETYPDDDAPASGRYPLVGPADHRWRPVAAVAAGVFVLAVIATVVILNGGDSASTTATVVSPTRTVIATPRPTAPPSASLPPETVTTVTPAPRKPSATPTAGPTVAPNATPPPEVNPRTLVYQVTGTKQLVDLVSVIYTDAQGMPHTDLNVSLPWSKTVVLNPGVQTTSVVATSLTGRLNCAITDAQGQTVVASANNAIIATCTR